MYFVYVLKDKITQELYYGYTNNLKRRLEQHNTDKIKIQCSLKEIIKDEKNLL
jgi:predicted GIY-YIG superfamily endonuclease